MSSPFFTGNNRLEFSPLFGRPIRMGSPEELQKSDTQCVIEALQNKDKGIALEYINLFNAIYDAVVGTFLEWCIDLPAEIQKHATSDSSKKILSNSYDIFCSAVIDSKSRYLNSSVEVSLKLLNPKIINENSIHYLRDLRAKGEKTIIDEFLSHQRMLFSSCLEFIENGDFTSAQSKYKEYLMCARSNHDLMGHYITVIGGVLTEYLPQHLVVEILQEGLESCPVLEHMWKAFETLPPDALAAMLAEHLRAHYSGSNREGSVKIIEENDKYRLVFEPCGTGGAMRCDKIKGLSVLPEATPESWGIANEVPPYCAHCAKNELTSIKRIGFPVWVTEFNPDPTKPCGWTVYKDPKQIPESYFTRLGVIKDTTTFKK